jgi:opacity protein-like surface antigen
MKKIIAATAILLGASSAALAQSAWTTGTAADTAAAGYNTPYGGGLYAYDPGFASRHSSGLHAFAMVPRTQAGSSDNPALTGGGSWGYNESVRHDW